MVTDKPPVPFSKDLKSWLQSDQPKTLADLTDVFGERSFAVVILLLMFLPALPLPTGGVTHIFELITMLLALELVVGRRTIWLPRSLKHRELGKLTQQKAIPLIIRRVEWFEKISRPRFANFLNHHLFVRVVGLVILAFTVAAFLAPPFSGLDTLPSMAVIALALALILGDTVIFIIGCLLGIGGIAVEVALGKAVFSLFHHFF